ncbi:MMPL family transporter [Burkholderia latens]|uniref:Lipoprotein transmembrane n=1 Tax=Burkholderia latens TaxID=488446 RepID=A0A6H9TIW4_9BURK|nr:MMPL family transporter [Burkholderia latens]KAB0643708.1 MMPL family transporter [Burkholderia latens]VWB70288.1 lipoprotein transmembrane [Burkholderia latens]
MSTARDVTDGAGGRNRRRMLCAAWLLVTLAAVAIILWRFSGPAPLQTNLLALLPATEANPVAERAVDLLGDALGNRTVYLVSDPDAARAKAAAKLFGARLTASGAFRSVTVEVPPFDLSQIAATYLPARFGLLTDADRSALERGGVALDEQLARRLYAPPDDGLQTAVADDPFGWLQHWLGALPLAASDLSIEDGMLVSHRDRATGVLVMTSLPGSAYESKIQHAVRVATADAERALAADFHGVRIDRAGAVFYAEAARASAERDVHVIGAVSLAGIALLLMSVFRSPRLLVLAFASTAFGIVCALAATLLVFGKLHLLTLVFGVSLIGEAVDYSIQYFVAYLSAGRQWDARRGAAAVRPALAVALATSLLGYAILMWVPFPALRQIACFAIVGILSAFAAVIGFLPLALVRGPRRVPSRAFAYAARVLSGWQALLAGRRAVAAAVLVALAAIPGWVVLKSDDDIHLLIQRDANLARQENRIRAAVGLANTAQFFVVQGASPEEVLERSEALIQALDRQRVGRVQSIATFVPSARRQAHNRAALATHVFADAAALRESLARAGFRDEVADAWMRAFSRDVPATLTVDTWLAARWSAPFRHLWLGQIDGGAGPVEAALAIPERVDGSNAATFAAVARTLPGVSWVDKAASVSSLFGAYRVDSGRWLAAALIVVAALLMWRYGVRGGIVTTLPVVFAIALTLAAFGYARVPLTLFNWLALMLVLGVGANYAVFLREGCLRDAAGVGAVWTGVLLSAATTLLSFGMLGASAMPALRSFGTTLAMGIVFSVLFAPLATPSTKERRA